MPGWLKAILIIVGTSLIALVVVIVIGVRYLSTHSDDIKKQFDADNAAGVKAGEGKPQTVCVDAALAEAKRDSSFRGTLHVQFFFMSCVKAAQPAPDFCAGVPTGFAPQWAFVECARRHLPNNQGCMQVMNLWRAQCQQQERR